MEIKRIHDFHFVMDREMKEKLGKLKLSKKSMTLSGTLVNILQLLIPVIRKEHKWGKQRLSRYRAVCGDPEIIRDHVHLYIPNELYRALKLLHQDLNFYSIAQLVRELVDLFLGFVDVYKDKVIFELKKIFTRWKSENEQTRLTPREFLRQLWILIRFLPGKNRLVTIYDNNYSPFWIMRI